jgi:hypothetical protein
VPDRKRSNKDAFVHQKAAEGWLTERVKIRCTKCRVVIPPGANLRGRVALADHATPPPPFCLLKLTVKGAMAMLSFLSTARSAHLQMCIIRFTDGVRKGELSVPMMIRPWSFKALRKIVAVGG